MRPVMIMAGGTGGHVYPALAVADELKQRGVPVVWMGTKKGIEARLVPEAGIDVDWLGMSGLRGKGLFTLLLAPLKIIMACYQAVKILHKRKPSVVLGMGGFVSAPGGLMAWVTRTPLLIHEQNAVPGMSNRMLSRIANKVMEAFPGGFKTETVHVGNPVRRSITSLSSPQQRNKERDGALRILVFGGSLGAARLNEIVPQACAKILQDRELKIKHQAGPGNFDQTRLNYSHLKIKAEVLEYIDDMESMYSWADLVICRAGAMTVSELAAAGVASVLVPYPYAVDDHQTYNAKYLSDAGAAILLNQNDLNVDTLVDVLKDMDREKTLEMANKARQLGMPESTKLVAEACLMAGGYDVN
ncbi:MAG: undecaprenyldiphospho-muramoylpentapeptide beta-N-acetylglucosaminyltransferase [endosymbiont of Galathealinum brachiosum]|uniref:UDP-N-acetylglucosamine--N-acetylmuramyl-(pentapeptide) pyrophosphoryl-undecaprenol N-acetylglucosamine transferase n=1 Tax=endosymbiont of Galathealinum brachiosum TaxID=2200906 RepID=A0A370DAT9_9GAMM|nr:MAG: undecaprenyldiphospho-muramoylpentapeptide beta-N-acetylglucosaminyltransferase [endosymbiont of Galathealinum brachiosum]